MRLMQPHALQHPFLPDLFQKPYDALCLHLLRPLTRAAMFRLVLADRRPLHLFQRLQQALDTAALVLAPERRPLFAYDRFRAV